MTEREPSTPVIPAWISEKVPDGAEDFPYRLGESPEERQAVRDTALRARVEAYRARVPSRFTDASLTDLTPAQDPGGHIRSWWGNGAATLILRSDTPGVGKTHAAYAVGAEAIESGATVAAWSMLDLNDALRPGGDPDAYQWAQITDLLIVDDMGRERITDWTLERLQGLLDARWREQRRQLVTTNLDGPAFLARYGQPVVDRIRDASRAVVMPGKSRRTVAPW